jgi:hypothetical protein
VQVSDRLVSISQGGKVRPLDPFANKAIIYCASDALVSIGYSGIACIGSMETDAWLAECLSGEPLPLGPDDESYAMCFGGQSNQWNIGYASKTLREASKNCHASRLMSTGYTSQWQGGKNNGSAADLS